MDQFDQRCAFLDEVLAAPDSDAPRLIYADYLEELGDPRGEFIRKQCQLAQLDELDPAYLDLAHRCDELLFEHREMWAGELKQDVRRIEFARGFIHQITMRARAFVGEADALYRTTPVNWMRFNYVKGAGQALAKTPVLSKIRSLDLSELNIPESDLLALLTSPFLSNLEALKLTHYNATFNQAIGVALREMPSADSLRHLEISGHTEFVNALSGGEGFAHLKHFAIGTGSTRNDLSGLRTLRIPKLQSLRVRGALRVADAEAMTNLPLDRLQKLDLQTARIPARGLRAFAARGAFGQLEELSLYGSGLGVRSIPELLKNDQLLECRSLDLTRNPSLGEGPSGGSYIEEIAEKPFKRLRRLHLCGLKPGAVRFLVRSEAFFHLRLLELESCHLGPEDLAMLAQSPIGQSLRELRIAGCRMDMSTVNRLGQTRSFANLIRLELGGGFDDLGTLDESTLIKLVTSPLFPQLQALKLDYLYIPNSTFNAIAREARTPELRQISLCHIRTSRKSIDVVLNSSRLPKLSKLILTGSRGLRNREKLIADYGSKVQL